jgi:outer membrane protein assembly factor BamA
VTGTQRRLELELYTAFTEPLSGAGDVPFAEQVSLGGARPLRGFGSRRLIDRSAAVATLRYRWPVWAALDGVLHYAVGNVFGPELRGLGLSHLRASFGAGITTVTDPDQSFEVLVAFGTETFEAGGAVESTRLTAGTSVNF